MLRRILSTKNKARQLHRMMLGQLLAHDLLHDEKRRIFQSNSLLLAEREGFEPPIPLRVCRISSAVLSTTQPPLRRADLYNVFGQAQARACAACGYFALETPSDGPLMPYF